MVPLVSINDSNLHRQEKMTNEWSSLLGSGTGTRTPIFGTRTQRPAIRRSPTVAAPSYRIHANMSTRYTHTMNSKHHLQFLLFTIALVALFGIVVSVRLSGPQETVYAFPVSEERR